MIGAFQSFFMGASIPPAANTTSEYPYTLTNTITYKGETFTLNTNAKVGYALNGQPFVVSDTPNLTWTASSTPSAIVGSYLANGAQFDPWYVGSNIEQGVDGILGAVSGSQGAAIMTANNSLNDDPALAGAFPITVGLCGRILKTVRKTGMTAPDGTWKIFQKKLHINIVPAVPPAGAVCPIYDGAGNVQWITDTMVRKSVLRGWGYVSGQKTLASCKTDGWVPDVDFPMYFSNSEQARLFRADDIWVNGYGAEFGTTMGTTLQAMHAEGAANVLDSDFYHFITIGAYAIEAARRGNYRRGGAGQNLGIKPLAVLVAMSTRDTQICNEALLSEGNETHQQFFPDSTYLDIATGFPGSSGQGYEYRWPYEQVHIDGGSAYFFHGDQALPPAANTYTNLYDSDYPVRYEVTSGKAGIIGVGVMAAFQDGPSGVDGLTFLLNGGPYNKTNPYAAAHAYWERYVRTNQHLTNVSEVDPADALFYERARTNSSLARWPAIPDAFAPTTSQNTYISAVTGGFSLDFTNALQDGGSTPTRLDLGYSLDGGISYYDDLNVGPLTYSRTDLPRGVPVAIRNRRQNSVGMGPWSHPWPKDVGRLINVTVTNNSANVVVNSSSGPTTSIAVGQIVDIPNIPSGSVVTSLGTYNNGTGTGTLVLSDKAYANATVSGAVGLGRFIITPSGTPSGTPTNVQLPSIKVRPLVNFTGRYYSDAPATVPAGTTLYGGVGWWTGDLTAGKKFKWRRGLSVDISGAIGESYIVQNADLGQNLYFGVSYDNGSTYVWSNPVSVPGITYPPFNLVAFDGTADYMTRTGGFLGSPASTQQVTFATQLAMSGSDSVSKVILTLGDASGTSSVDNLLTVTRTSANRITFTMRDSAGTIVFNVTTSSGTVNVAAGEIRIMVSLNLSTSTYQFYIDNTALTLGSVTGTLNAFALASVQRIFVGSSLNSATLLPANMRYMFLHNSYIDLSNSVNRDKFLTSNIGNQGENIFGTPALMMLYGDAASWNAGYNYGTGGNLTMVGSVV